MDKLKEVDWRGLYKSATQKVKKYTLNLTDLEIKVEEATNAETWGPHGSVMNEIADAAFDPENYRQIMGVLARRLQEKDENWRMCYKALLLLEHLLKHGPGKIVGDVQASSGVLERLQHFQYKDANLKDHGVNVRHRAKEILQLVNSPQRLREERDKAKANRAKYGGVSADQMRSMGSSSFGRSASDRFTGTTGSLGGGGGGLGGLGGSLGGSGSYAMSRRTESYDETDQESHYISKRPGGASASAGAEVAPAGAGEDPVAATRARIERLKLAEDRPAGEAAEAQKKKLTDVRVNPKIAASLGLKMPAPAPAAAAQPAAAAPAQTTSAAAAAADIDLLGGLDDPAPAAPVAAPAAPAAAFDPFAVSAPAASAPTTASQQHQQPAWDAFEGAAPSAPPAASAAPAVDLFGGLGSSPAPAPAPAAAPADPFAAFTAPAAAVAPALQAPVPAARPTAPAAPAGPLPSVAAGVPAALPEDMFSDLTGIGKPQQPMGHSMHPPAAAPAAGAGASAPGWGAPAPAPPAPSAGFADFSGAVPAALPAQQQAHAPVAGAHARTGSMGGSVDFGSFSYSAPAQAAGASASDPFADLLK